MLNFQCVYSFAFYHKIRVHITAILFGVLDFLKKVFITFFNSKY